MRVRLEDVCEKESSKLKQSDVIDQNGLYPVYGASGYLGNINTYQQSNYYVAVVKDDAGIGRTMLLPPKSSIIGTMQYLIPKDNVQPEYLYYVVKAKHLEKYFSGATIPHIYFKDYKNEQFDLVSFEEQRDIINRLKKIEIIIDNLSKNLLLLDELVKARFVEMFGDPSVNPMNWDIVNISEVVKGKVSNGFFAKRDDYIDDGNVSVMGVAYIVNRMYSQWTDLPRTNGTDKDIEKYEVQYGDMLFCRSSLVAEGIGKASIVPENVPENILFECHVIRLPLDLSKCVPEFMQVLSTTDFFRQQIIAESKTATMTTIGQNGVLKADIILPPISKQKEFYAFVKQVDKSEFVSGKAIGQRENRWMQDVNHCVSKALVENNLKHTFFVLEDLSGIRNVTERVKTKDLYVSVSWSFYNFEQKLIYKAKWNQSSVIKVAPRYTSQCCPDCGYTEKSNHNKKIHLFTCKNCGYQSNDDRIGAMNCIVWE